MSASVAEAQTVEKSRLQACPYSPAELRSALGGEWRAGKSNEQPSPEGRMLGCSYSAGAAGLTLLVSQTWIPVKILAETTESMDRYSSGRFTPVRGDSDKARWLTDAQSSQPPQSISLVYMRRNVRTEVRLLGSKAGEQALKSQLLKLKRVP